MASAPNLWLVKSEPEKYSFEDLQRDGRTVWDGEGPMGIKLGSKLELQPNGDSTTVTIEVSFDGGPLAGPLGASVAAAVTAYERGATILRVHDVREHVDALAVARAVSGGV